MRQADVFVDGVYAGTLEEIERGRKYTFVYAHNYNGQPISLTMPLTQKHYHFDAFPPYFDGLLPEGTMLEALLKRAKIDRDDLFSQLVTVGEDLIGNVQVRATK